MFRKLILSFVFMFFSGPALAGISLIRDAEIEHTIRQYSNPIYVAAGMAPESVRMFIVNDRSINAFVAGGSNMFLHTGLIMESKNPEMLMGVIAHETGHIAGGHIVKRTAEIEDASVTSVVSTILGAAVTVAGLPQVGGAILGGGSALGAGQFLQYSREQEVVADKYALNLMTQIGKTSKGTLEVMELIRREQQLSSAEVPAYLLTHPMTQQRIAYIRAYVDKSDLDYSDEFDVQHGRMLAKLEGFLNDPEWVLAKYGDDSDKSRYARSIVYYRQSEMDDAVAELDALIAKYPNDPFYNEFKGQVLFENGKVAEAIPYYEIAVREHPQAAILKHELGKILLQAGRTDEGITYLKKATKLEPREDSTWRLLATAYGQMGEQAKANLMLAEESKLLRKNQQAKTYAKAALEDLQEGSAEYLQAKDLIEHIENDEKKKER